MIFESYVFFIIPQQKFYIFNNGADVWWYIKRFNVLCVCVFFIFLPVLQIWHLFIVK